MTGFVSYQAFTNPTMKGSLLFLPTAIKSRGEYHRFITSGFIHADWIHLLVNMYVLFIFGEAAEFYFGMIFGDVFGRIAYILFYVSAIAIASLPSYFRHQDNYGYAALGASGATSALVFCYIVINPWAGISFLFLPFIEFPAILLGVAYLFYSSYMDKKGTDNIGHNAHFWGAVYGVVFILVSCLIFQPAFLTFILESFLSGPAAFFSN
jgi:membrane associated rhomboid family serine protease